MQPDGDRKTVASADVANRTMRFTAHLVLGPGSSAEKMRTMMERRDSNVFAVFATVRRELADIC
jgi:hypothetical protein